MTLISVISNMIVPAIFIFFLTYGYINKVEVYDAFLEGAKEGIKVVFDILPTLIGLMTAVGVLRACGFLDIVTNILKPLMNLIGFPAEAIPLIVMKPISSSASTGLFFDLMKNYGVNSFVSKFAAILLGSTETIFYVLSLYSTASGIKDTRYCLKGALLSMLTAIIGSLIAARLV